MRHLLAVIFAGFVLASATAQTVYKNVQKSPDGNNRLTESLAVPTGKTLTAESGSTVTLSGSVGGTPTGGTLSLSNLTLTLPATVSGGTSSFQPLDADLTSWAAITRASGFDTFTATPSSANLRSLLSDESGTGVAYFQGGNLGTPSAGVLTNATGLPISTGVSGLGTGVATALAVNVGSAGAPVVFNGALGTPSSGTLTNATGLPVSTGISGLGTGVATALAVNVGTAGAPVINGGALGTPSSGTVTNLTGTASININGTVGATTPNTVAATTIAASGIISANATGVMLQSGNGGTSANYIQFQNTGGFSYFGVDNSTGATLGSANAYDLVAYGASGFSAVIAGTNRLRITGGGGTLTGNLNVTGSLSKGSGTFKIDHPLESLRDTHYLVHSFVEGPRADLIYRGSATLSSGSATVDIDAAVGMTSGTFVALTANPQVWLQNESGWTPVRGSVSAGVLTITAKDPVSESISWLVVAERADPNIKAADWTDANGRPILEPAKNVDLQASKTVGHTVLKQ